MSKKLVDHLISTNYNGISNKIKTYRKPKKTGTQKSSRSRQSADLHNNIVAHVYRGKL